MPIIETNRLILRPPIAQDLEGFVKFHNDPITMKHLGGVQPPNVAWRALTTIAGAWSLYGFSFFSVILKENNEWIGRIGPIYPEGWPFQEIGWSILSKYTKKGLALEATRATINFAFNDLGWKEIGHIIVTDNKESENLARRLGSKLIGETQLPEPFNNIKANKWGQSKEEWLNHSSQLNL